MRKHTDGDNQYAFKMGPLVNTYTNRVLWSREYQHFLDNQGYTLLGGTTFEAWLDIVNTRLDIVVLSVMVKEVRLITDMGSFRSFWLKHQSPTLNRVKVICRAEADFERMEGWHAV